MVEFKENHDMHAVIGGIGAAVISQNPIVGLVVGGVFWMYMKKYKHENPITVVKHLLE